MKSNYSYNAKRLGATIKELIKHSDYKTQEAYANHMNVELRTVSRWVNGELDSISTLYQVCESLNVSVSEIIAMSEMEEK